MRPIDKSSVAIVLSPAALFNAASGTRKAASALIGNNPKHRDEHPRGAGVTQGANRTSRSAGHGRHHCCDAEARAGERVVPDLC